MSISGVTYSPIGVTDRPSTRDTQASDDTSTSSFAGVLSGAMNAAAPKPLAPTKKEGTSELDGNDDDADSSDDSDSTTTTSSDATTAAPAAPDNSGGIVRSLGALDPALQAKLARVIERVRAETGHDVTVAETYRSQSRQDQLYAQGRDTTGPVVTWTQNSKHTQGRAVDLLLDGGAAGAGAYADLQRIANDEGLRTLGAKDPGHLELPASGAAATNARNATTIIPAEPADASGQGQVSIASVAQIARVADVKATGVAQVARVATVAQNARLSAITAGNTRNGGSKSDSSSGSDAQSDQRGGYGSLTSTFSLTDLAPAAPVAATGTQSAERVATVMAAIEDAPARPLSQITMSVDAGNGASDRVHVALRGVSVNTTIDTADLRTAQTMSAKSDELVRSLNRDGLEVESLRVRSAVNATATIATPSSQGSSNSSTGSRFERGNPWDQTNRQRSQGDRRQQQRDQRKDKDQ